MGLGFWYWWNPDSILKRIFNIYFQSFSATANSVLWTCRGPKAHNTASLVSQRERICLQCRRHRRHEFDPWVGKMPWRRAWQPTPVFLPGKSYGQSNLVDYSPWGNKESDTTELLSTHTQNKAYNISTVLLTSYLNHPGPCPLTPHHLRIRSSGVCSQWSSDARSSRNSQQLQQCLMGWNTENFKFIYWTPKPNTSECDYIRR